MKEGLTILPVSFRGMPITTQSLWRTWLKADKRLRWGQQVISLTGNLPPDCWTFSSHQMINRYWLKKYLQIWFKSIRKCLKHSSFIVNSAWYVYFCPLLGNGLWSMKFSSWTALTLIVQLTTPLKNDLFSIKGFIWNDNFTDKYTGKQIFSNN